MLLKTYNYLQDESLGAGGICASKSLPRFDIAHQRRLIDQLAIFLAFSKLSTSITPVSPALLAHRISMCRPRVQLALISLVQRGMIDAADIEWNCEGVRPGKVEPPLLEHGYWNITKKE